jgi:hypothetical protein
MTPHDAIREQIKKGLETIQGAAGEKIDELARQVKSSLAASIPADPGAAFPGIDAALAGLGAGAAAGAAGGAITLELLRRLDAARSQSELLKELLTELSKQVSRVAVLVIREGAISAWSGMGFADNEKIRQWRAQVNASENLQSMASSGQPLRVSPASDAVLSQWLDASEVPRDAFLLPVCLRGKLVGCIYVDHGKGATWDPSNAQVLIAVICWLIDTLGFRQNVPSPMVQELNDLVGDGPAAAAEEQFDPSATIRVDTAQMAAMAAAAEAPAAAPQAAAPAAKGPEDDAKHEEARRFARLLVSEIKLYNEVEVDRGRQGKDIYKRLKEDIDRSREMFDKRIPPEVREVRDYFHEEMVRVLADGDADALGM